MKGKKRLTVLLYGLIAWGIAYCGAGCIVTAFSFGESAAVAASSGAYVNMWVVALWSAAISLLSAFVFTKLRHWVTLPIMVAAVLGVLFAAGMLEEFHELAHRISIFYDKAYGWGVISRPVNMEGSTHSSMIDAVEGLRLTGGLATVCTLVVLAVNWVLCSQKPAAIAVVAGFLPLMVCCVVTDTVPDEKYLFPLLAGLALVILTGTARRNNEKAGAQMTAIVMIPVLLASMMLSDALPRESYEQQSEALLQTMLDWVQALPFLEMGPDGKLEFPIVGKTPESVDLAQTGPLNQGRYPVLDVISSTTQRLYLREQSFDTYDGKSWTNSTRSSGVDTAWPQKVLANIGTVQIRTRGWLSYRFVPYYTEGSRELEKGAVANPDRDQEYYYTLVYPIVDSMGVFPSMAVACTELSPETSSMASVHSRFARTLANGKYDDLRLREMWAACIADYVRSSAAYSRSTSQMPENAEDFALWFLENGETGYCVHFATAATVLLRAAGVPARYVTGYAVDVVAGKKVTITANQSHAWVEYLNDDNIWTVLDATPAEWMNDQSTTDPTPTEGSTEQPTEEETTAPAPTVPGNTRPADEPTETRSATTPESAGGTGDQSPETDRTVLWTALKWLAGILGMAAVLALQYILRRQLRKKWRIKGEPNRQALYRYREAKRMAWLTGQKVPEVLLGLAEKAKFSQHTLTEEELAQMDAHLAEAQRLLQKKPWPLQFVIRLIWAV